MSLIGKESFLMYKSFYEPIKSFSLEEKGMLFDAIFNYQICSTEPKLSPTLMMAFAFFKNQFRLDEIKYEKTCKRNQENGIKPKRRKKKELNKPVGASGLFGSQWEPVGPTGTDNDNEKDNDNDNGKENDINTEIHPHSPPQGEQASGASEAKPESGTQEKTSNRRQTGVVLTLDETELKDKVRELYSRKATTDWTQKELRQLRDIAKRTDWRHEFEEIRALYTSGYKYQRNDIITFLNNWTGEYDRSITRKLKDGIQ